ncbi:MAG: thiamine-phosphate synthase family protein [Nitrososphaerota archaeon]
MMPPSELMVKYLLPNIRGLISHELYSKGFSQLKISSILGISQSAVSQILSKPRDKYFTTLIKMGLKPDEVDLLVKLLLKDIQQDPVRSILTLESFWAEVLSRGVFCELHRKLYPQLSSCEICLKPIPEVISTEKLKILERLSRAIKIIEESWYFVNVMPQIAVNIVESIREAKTIDDVAGIPGRIVRIKDRPRAVSRPEFGGSRHLASVLLSVKKHSPEINSVVNLKLDELVRKAVISLGYSWAETSKPNTFPGEVNNLENLVIESISAIFKERPYVDVVFDRGGYGFEPTTYVFGRDSLEVVDKALKIAKKYVELTVRS